MPPIKAGSDPKQFNIVGIAANGDSVPLENVVFSWQGPGIVSINDERTRLTYQPPAAIGQSAPVEINVQGDGDSGAGVFEVYGQLTFSVEPANAVRIDLVEVV